MDKREITRIIETFAPLETAEAWDCSGWGINVSSNKEINTVMLCLTVTDDVICEARDNNCDMIISHHPLFYVPIGWKDIDIYCAHTNLDKAIGGTTDTLIDYLRLPKGEVVGDFLRIVDFPVTVDEFVKKLKTVTTNLRLTNKNSVKELKRIAFCAGSGTEFIEEAVANGADALVTGDIKFHTAVESPIVLFDIGHYESEILVLEVLKKLLKGKIEVVKSAEKSPFITI